MVDGRINNGGRISNKEKNDGYGSMANHRSPYVKNFTFKEISRENKMITIGRANPTKSVAERVNIVHLGRRNPVKYSPTWHQSTITKFPKIHPWKLCSQFTHKGNLEIWTTISSIIESTSTSHPR